MIISRDMNPEREIYYLGAMIIDLLSTNPKDQISFFDVFGQLNERGKVSINLFALTLDWLFMLGIVNLRNGNVEKCF